MINLELLGLPTACWKCGGSTVALVAVAPAQAQEDDELYPTSEPAALAFAAAHLPADVIQVGKINERTSRTAGETSLMGVSTAMPYSGTTFCFRRNCLRSSLPKGPWVFGCWPHSAHLGRLAKRLHPWGVIDENWERQAQDVRDPRNGRSCQATPRLRCKCLLSGTLMRELEAVSMDVNGEITICHRRID
jgi:hypothetical protein